MIVAFRDQGAEDIFNGVDSRAANKCCPKSLRQIARRKLDQLDSVTKLLELRIPPGNRLETLRGSRQGHHSIRVNKQFRVCFLWTDAGPTNVEIVDYH